MSNLSLFMKQNKKKKENVKYAATKSLVDENGNVLEWELRPLSTRTVSKIREEHTIEVQVPGKIGMYRPKVNTNKFSLKLAAESVVFPDLYNKELQDSYGVMSPEDLLLEMIDNAGEFNDFIVFIQKYNGLNTNINDKVEEAKN